MLHDQIIASYGTWESPLSAEKVAEGVPSTMNLLIDGDDTYWSESRPTNKGRYTIVRRTKEGKVHDLTAPDFNARTFVHEYGGGAFTVVNGTIYASNGANSAIYTLEPGQAPRQLTEGQIKNPQTGSCQGTRFADLQYTPYGLLAVGEHHSPGHAVENFLALIDTHTGAYKKIATAHDFYASPALSNDGKKLAWICWDHPHMPWTKSELWIADITAEGLKHLQQIAGAPSESVLQPQWSPEGQLYFISDRDRGWWNIHRYAEGGIENMCPMEAEVGEPFWIFGRSTYAFLGAKIVFSYNQEGMWHLALLDPKTKQWQKIVHDRLFIHQLRSGHKCVRFLEGYAQKEECLVQIDDAPPLFDKNIVRQRI